MSTLNRSVATLLAVSVLVAAGTAEARHVHFAGPHPIAAKYGGGYCYIEAPHLHLYAPDHAALYQQVGEDNVFTGDPTPFGYEGDRHKFYGHHPLPSAFGEVYCLIDGPHYHSFAAPETPDYKVQDDVAFYVAPPSPAYVRLRPQREKQVNLEYRPYHSMRPVFEAPPPPEWHGEIYVPPPIEVTAPGVVVEAPPVFAPPLPPGASVHVSGPPMPPPIPGPPGISVHVPGVMVGVPVPPRPPGVVVHAPGVMLGVPGPPMPPRPPGVSVHVSGGVPLPPPPGVSVHVSGGVAPPPPPGFGPGPGVVVGGHGHEHEDEGRRKHGAHGQDEGRKEGHHK